MDDATRDHVGYSSEELDLIDARLKAGRTSEEILRNVDETLLTAMVGAQMLADDRYEFNGPITFTNIDPSEELPSDPSMPTRSMVSAMGYGIAQAHRRGIRIAITFGVATSHALQNLRSTEPGFDDWWKPRSQSLAADPLARYFYVLRSVLLKEGYLRATTAVTSYHVVEDSNWVEVATYFHGAPPVHRGEDISDRTALDLIDRYHSRLGELVAEAWSTFCPDADPSARMPSVVPGQLIIRGLGT